MNVTDIDTAIKHIECGISYGIIYMSNGFALDAAKAIAEAWSRYSAEAMIDYERMYPKKLYNINKPLFHDSYTLLRAVNFKVQIDGTNALIYMDLDDDVEPDNLESVQKIFKYLTYGVHNKTINIPARPLFFDVLGAFNKSKVIKQSLLNTNSDKAQYNFDEGYKLGSTYKYTTPEVMMRRAVKSIPKRVYTAKIINYITGELRWLEC